MNLTSLEEAVREGLREYEELMKTVDLAVEALPPEKPSMLYFYTKEDYPREE